MTPNQETNTTSNLQTVKMYLEAAIGNAGDEDFIPELAGMVERVGVILSGVRAGFYTQVPQAVPGTRIKLTATTQGTYGNERKPTGYAAATNWNCKHCAKTLRIGDVVNTLQAGEISHIDCKKPQG